MAFSEFWETVRQQNPGIMNEREIRLTPEDLYGIAHDAYFWGKHDQQAEQPVRPRSFFGTIFGGD